MVGTLIKQPNGKYCVIDYVGNVKHYNITEQDIINMYIEDAKACIGTAEHYGKLINKTVFTGYYESIKRIPDDILKEMGFDKTYDELLKYIPRRPIEKAYTPCNFTTYAECPNCGGRVQDGIGHTDEKCEKCNQLLKW